MDEVVDRLSLKHVVVAIEYCSSSQQPWNARLLLPKLFGDMESFILFSANPDRVTRRESELQIVMDVIESKGSEWWTLGLQGATTNWTRLNDPLACIDAESQLTTSRQVAVQQGLYTRAVNFETRILTDVRHQTAPEMQELQATMERLASLYNSVLVWTRTSPTFSKSEAKDGMMNASLRRQRTFLEMALEKVQKKKLTFKDISEVSAYGDEAMTHLRDALDGLNGPTLVVAVMADRLVRHAKHLPDLKEVLVQQQSQLVSILWDPLLFRAEDASEAGREWVTGYPLPPFHELTLTVLVPDT
ncbi:hypothetical protein BGZ65_002598 [Modicella reniformis]|uniref:Uncharacterized protein n=1 Tax=Modicella reniformis TaxID=1440133 RepID=A0A9P6SU90_9FUNG|nr:hypothetical protein BGZ65_002598 [Modicella reniformis]